ncbi:hypothetical protein C0J29_26495 [Mycobacterium paragordonae]|nr:hypothetical protein C0J29_26495 [Mycobacterium paragordonae]
MRSSHAIVYKFESKSRSDGAHKPKSLRCILIDLLNQLHQRGMFVRLRLCKAAASGEQPDVSPMRTSSSGLQPFGHPLIGAGDNVSSCHKLLERANVEAKALFVILPRCKQYQTVRCSGNYLIEKSTIRSRRSKPCFLKH